MFLVWAVMAIIDQVFFLFSCIFLSDDFLMGLGLKNRFSHRKNGLHARKNALPGKPQVDFFQRTLPLNEKLKVNTKNSTFCINFCTVRAEKIIRRILSPP